MNPARLMARLSDAQYAALVALATDLGLHYQRTRRNADTANVSALIRRLADLSAHPASRAALIALLTADAKETDPL